MVVEAQGFGFKKIPGNTLKNNKRGIFHCSIANDGATNCWNLNTWQFRWCPFSGWWVHMTRTQRLRVTSHWGYQKVTAWITWHTPKKTSRWFKVTFWFPSWRSRFTISKVTWPLQKGDHWNWQASNHFPIDTSNRFRRTWTGTIFFDVHLQKLSWWHEGSSWWIDSWKKWPTDHSPKWWWTMVIFIPWDPNPEKIKLNRQYKNHDDSPTQTLH